MRKRIWIFVGAYGSGKTEVAINYCFRLRARGGRVAIGDLDLVNPYFRSRELRERFEAQGIEVLAPPGELAGADLPIIVPEIRGYLTNPEVDLVLDVGGDDAGSRALAGFAPFIPAGSYEMYMVVNDRRPWTGESAGIAEAIRRVEGSSRMEVTALVSNPNLGEQTTAEVVEQGHATIDAAATELGLPVAWLSVVGTLAGRIRTSDGVPVVEHERHLFPPWYEDPLRLAPSRDRRSRVMVQDIAERTKERT